MLLERWQCGIFAFGPDEKMQVNSMEAEEKQTTEALGLGKPLWWKVRKSNIFKMDDDHQKVFLITSLFTDPDPPVRVAGRIGKLVSQVFFFNKLVWQGESGFLFFVKKVKSRIPILTWLPKYSLEWLVSDMIAGITVGLTVIPQVKGKFLKHRLDWNHQSQWLQVSSKCII